MAQANETTRDGHVERRGNDLVEANLRLVDHVVGQMAASYPRHVDRDELRSAGILGLVDAARRFDAEGGSPFAPYAMIRIRGAIIDSIRGRDWATRSVRRRQREQRAAGERFAQERGRQPSREELAAFMGVSEERIEATRADARAAQMVWLDRPLGRDGGTVGTEVPEADADFLPQKHLEEKELHGTLHTAIELLPEVQRDVLRRTYFGGEILRDVAVTYGVTEARISQIRNEAIASMRAYFASSWGRVDEDARVPERGTRNRTSFVHRMQDETTWRQRLDAAPSPA